MKDTERQAHIQAWQHSGLSRPSYCKAQGLKYSTFMKWCTDAGIKKNKKRKKKKKSFLEISLPSSMGYDISLPNGIQINCSGVMTAQVLKMLLDA